MSQKSTTILDHFPSGLTPFPWQTDLLLQVEEAWDNHDVFCVTAPTAAGKTALQLTIANWQAACGSSAVVNVSSNVILDQYVQRHPEITALFKKEYYGCKCKGGHDKGCKYLAAKRAAQKASVVVCNYYTYWCHKLHRPTVIFDEGHQLVEQFCNKREVRISHHEFGFPLGFVTAADVLEWLEKRVPSVRTAKMIKEIRDIKTNATIEYVRQVYNGQKDLVLTVVPDTSNQLPAWLWPWRSVNKIVLMSATMSSADIKELGLDRQRVKYLSCASPIPAAQRVIKYESICNMAAQSARIELPKLAHYIRRILSQYPDSRGMIHLPYAYVPPLKELLADEPRLLWHNREDKRDVLQQFRAEQPYHNRVFVASGLYEGVDLPYDAARFQIIAKVPYLSLGSPYVLRKMAESQDWYDWEAIKRVVQAAGRIVRAVDDFGVTYIPDVNFAFLCKKDRKRLVSLFPQFFIDALAPQLLKRETT